MSYACNQMFWCHSVTAITILPCQTPSNPYAFHLLLLLLSTLGKNVPLLPNIAYPLTGTMMKR